MIELTQIEEKFPFLSCIRYQEDEFIGIIQNMDEKIITFYDFNSMQTSDEKKLFLSLGDIWWWESNRMLPINIFLSAEMKIFRPYTKTFNIKDSEVIFGPTTSLNNLMQKRIKRRQITLVRKPD